MIQNSPFWKWPSSNILDEVCSHVTQSRKF